MGEIGVVDGQVSAHGLVNGPHALLLLSNYDELGKDGQSNSGSLGEVHTAGSGPQPIVLRLPEGVQGHLWDLARGIDLGVVEPGGESKFSWQPAMPEVRTGLYYIGPREFPSKTSAD